MDSNQNNNDINVAYLDDPYSYVPKIQKNSEIGISSLVVGICAFFFDPLYICSLLAVIFGIIGIKKKDVKKSCAIAGIICGIASFFVQLVSDCILSFFIIGFGSVSFFC